MPDRLRALVNARDRANARPHRLEPERSVLPKRGGQRKRTVCFGCRRVPWEADWAAAYDRYLAAKTQRQRDAVRWPCLTPSENGETACTECGGELVEVTV